MLLKVIEVSKRIAKILPQELGHHVVGAQHRMEHRRGKHGDFIGMLFGNDLHQDGARDVLARLTVDDLDRRAVADQLLDLRQRDIAAGVARVEAPVRITLDANRFGRHGGIE